jgi:Tfp pilus assembly protein PilZ
MAKGKRKSERVKRRLPVQVWKAGTDESLSGTTKDVSPDGIFVQTQKPFPPGTEVVIEMLHSGKTIKLEGVVTQASRVAGALQSVQTSGMGIKATLPGEFVKDVVGERRASPRVAAKIKVVGFYGSEKHLFELKNLSETGAALISKNAISEIAFTRMNFKVSRRSRVLDLDAIPIRIEPIGEKRVMLAVQFLDPAEGVAEQLKDFVEERATGSSGKRRAKMSR